MGKIEKKLPQITKGSSMYKLIVPEEVEEKIRYLLRKFPSTEWSGVLFYTHEGTFEDDNLVITCKDIYPMDLGNATYTEFRMSEDVASYMADNIELFDCDMGLVHSHHVMSTFFSGTDVSTLQEEGNERNCFVSLIVNNAGEYNAAITRKLQSKSEVTVKKLGISYEFFGDGEISVENAQSPEETKQVVSSDTIEYFMMEVERHTVSNHLDYLDKRFEEIQEKKRSTSTINAYNNFNAYDGKSYSSWNYNRESETPKSYLERSAEEASNSITKSKWWYDDDNKNRFNENEPMLWDWKKEEAEEKTEEEDIPFIDYTPDPDAIHAAAVHMITCSLLLNPDKCDLKQWIHKHMSKMYEKMFPDNGDMRYSSFEVYCDFIVEFMVRYFYDLNIPVGLEEDEIASIVAQALLDEISPYKEENEYMKKYCKTLEEYIL